MKIRDVLRDVSTQHFRIFKRFYLFPSTEYFPIIHYKLYCVYMQIPYGDLTSVLH